VSDNLSDYCNQINRNASIELGKRKNKMSKSNFDWSDFTEGLGCFTIIGLVLLVLLLIIPLVVFIFGTITGGLIYLGWNLALVPICGLAPITMWWQAFGLGVLVNVVSGIFTRVVVKKKED
jgi:uncharacterized RDD family membrane protein YckC